MTIKAKAKAEKLSERYPNSLNSLKIPDIMQALTTEPLVPVMMIRKMRNKISKIFLGTAFTRNFLSIISRTVEDITT